MHLAFQQRSVVPLVWSASWHEDSRVWPDHWRGPLEQQKKFSSQKAITWSICRMSSKDGIEGKQNLTTASLPILPNLHSWIEISSCFTGAPLLHQACYSRLLWKCGCQGELLQLNCISIFYKIHNVRVCRYSLIIIRYRIIHIYLHEKNQSNQLSFKCFSILFLSFPFFRSEHP